ncbi:hypothetical protein [Jiangella mangrovi]|uniref:Prenyltransferase n=1 Tax=Jiangella mangrovi TaxID=1524084 RepID=A0A7W9LPW5_9ACTN|nr:hypothetical protein [Jiangella mangrovi]MBB5791830.1 hypothetical protein [Jiangella mangrovi]
MTTQVNPAPPPGWTGPSLTELDQACRRAVEWVRGHARPDGALGDPADGFKTHRAPWALTLAGETDLAQAYCGWVRRELLRDGRLDGPARLLDDGWAYRDSTLVIGAHMLEQYDLSYGVIDHLCSWQDPASGGFANDRLPDGSGSDEMDIPYACGPGFAALVTGRLDVARRVAAFLATVYDAQQELPDRLHLFFSRRDQRPILPSDPQFEQRFVVENAVDRNQRWTAGGIAAGFLGRLYLVDRDPALLELARRYQAFSMSATDAQFKYPAVCKTSWGAALLYQITGEDQYRDWLARMADWYLDTQDDGGYWHPVVENCVGDVLEVTLEFVMHVKILSGALVSRPARTG